VNTAIPSRDMFACGGAPSVERSVKIEALLFDVDGTLADTEEAHRRAFNAAFEHHGLKWEWSVEMYADLLRVTGGKERIGHYIAALSLLPADEARLRRLIPALHATKTRLFTEVIEQGNVPARPGVRRLMMEALAAGVRLGIASTTSPENVQALLTACLAPDASTWFSVIATGDVVSRKKPAPDIYQLALTKLSVLPEHVIAVEDSAIGVRAAKAAGLFTVATPSRWTARQDFSAADLVLPSLGDPDQPLGAPASRRIGAKYLGVEQLRAFHAAALRSERSANAAAL
jgi:HAD superfamily hydrolase (TIGR01509 family)